jgi:hypothetical protein
MKKLVFLILFISISVFTQAQHSVSFFEEHIDFSLDSKYFSINGIYSFHNNDIKEVNQQIVFPFADKTSTIDSIRIINLSTGSSIKFERLDSTISFSFALQPNDTVDLNIFYRQRISTKNKYIITSTQSWGKPLETAVYTLTTEKKLKIKSFSYEPDTVRIDNDQKIYNWQKHSFMPKSEFEITIDKYQQN